MKRDNLYEILLTLSDEQLTDLNIKNKDIIQYMRLLMKFKKSNIDPNKIIIDAIQNNYKDGKVSNDDFKSMIFGLKSPSDMFIDMFSKVDRDLYEAKVKPIITLDKAEYNEDKFNFCYLHGTALSAYYVNNRSANEDNNGFVDDIVNFINNVGKTKNNGKFIFETVTKLSINNIKDFNKVYKITKEDFVKLSKKVQSELLDGYCYIEKEDHYNFISAIKLDLPNDINYYEIDSITGIPKLITVNTVAIIIGGKKTFDTFKVILRTNIELENPGELAINIRSKNELVNYIDVELPLVKDNEEIRENILSFHYLLTQYELIDTNLWIGKEAKIKTQKNG